jgi:hypothetical protein
MKGKMFTEIGNVTENSRFTVRGLSGAVTMDGSLADLRKSWKGTLSSGVGQE